MHQMDSSQALIIGCMHNIYYLIQHNIALNNYKSLYELVIYQIQNQNQTYDEDFIQNLQPPSHQNYFNSSLSTSNNYATYKNPVVERELLSSIFTIIEENVIIEVKNSLYWSLLIDKSNTNIISEKTIALVLKYLVNGEPIFCFLEMIQVTDASANRIMNIVKLFITQKRLDITKLRYFGSDGMATMTGL